MLTPRRFLALFALLALALALASPGAPSRAQATAPPGEGLIPPELLQQSPRRVVLAMESDLETVLAKGYEPFQVQANYGARGGVLIAISGVAVDSADGYNQWVFFFLNDTYLGTDTLYPSPQLAIVGNNGPGAISVRYANYAPGDPLCCPSLRSVVITYYWDGYSLTPDGTPPGH